MKRSFICYCQNKKTNVIFVLLERVLVVKMEINNDIILARIKQGALIPGKLSENQFFLLIEMSSIRSEKMVQALQEYLVQGKARIDIYKNHGVGSSHFSLSLDRLQRLSYLVSQLSIYYQE